MLNHVHQELYASSLLMEPITHITSKRISMEEISQASQEARPIVQTIVPAIPNANLSIGTVRQDIAISAQHHGRHLRTKALIAADGLPGNCHRNTKAKWEFVTPSQVLVLTVQHQSIKSTKE